MHKYPAVIFVCNFAYEHCEFAVKSVGLQPATLTNVAGDANPSSYLVPAHDSNDRLNRIDSNGWHQCRT